MSEVHFSLMQYSTIKSPSHLRFGWSTLSALKDSASRAKRSMTSMALNSIAYWMRASPAMVSKVRGYTACCYCLGYSRVIVIVKVILYTLNYDTM